LKKHRYKFSFFITALLYTLPFLAYLYLFKEAMVSVSEPNEKAIELSLSQFVPRAPAIDVSEPVQQEQLVEEEPEPEEKTEKEEEVEEEKEAPEPEPEKELLEKEPEPVVKEKPLPKKTEQVAKKTEKKPAQKRKTYKKKKKVHQKRKISGGGSPKYSAAQKSNFLARIRSRINRAKSYPRIAQRRGMQGVVRVRFTILTNGHVGNISLSGPKVFHASARKAVKSAFPVNVKKAPLRLPTTVNLTLRYTLH
jgi:protein TonB